MKARTIFLLLLFSLVFSYSYGEEDALVNLTVSASKSGVTVYLNSEDIGKAPAAVEVTGGDYVIEYLISPGNRIEHSFEINDESQIFVFADLRDRDVSVLRSNEEIEEFLNEFSLKQRFRKYFDEAMEYYKRDMIQDAIKALEKGLACCYSDEGRELLKKWREEVLPKGFVYIKGGRFLMGSDTDENQAGNSYPAHMVRIDDYAISEFEISNKDFAEFIEDAGYETVAELAGKSMVWDSRKKEYVEVEGASWYSVDGKQKKYRKNNPVTHISWYDATAYCAWYARQHGFEGKVVYLPTEAQWEFAARGSDARFFPWGDANPFKKNLAVIEKTRVDRVGSISRGDSPEGVHDLIGNVWEWTADYGDQEYYKKCKEESLVSNPRGAQFGLERSIRGGGYHSTGIDVSSTTRRFREPDYSSDSLGFRMAFNFCGCGNK